MKILHIIAGAKEGGAESRAADTIKALNKLGIQQKIICRPHEAFIKLAQDEEITYYNLSFSTGLKFLQKRKINSIIREEKPDIIHCWMNRAASLHRNKVKFQCLVGSVVTMT